jgi:hypothetical protein
MWYSIHIWKYESGQSTEIHDVEQRNNNFSLQAPTEPTTFGTDLSITSMSVFNPTSVFDSTLSTSLQPSKVWGKGDSNPPKIAIALSILNFLYKIIDIPLSQVKEASHLAINPTGASPPFTIPTPSSLSGDPAPLSRTSSSVTTRPTRLVFQ